MLARPVHLRTPRLDAREWHDAPLPAGSTLPEVVAGLLDPATTAWMPEPDRGVYDRERAAAWIAARDDDALTLLACRGDDGRPVGLLLLTALAGGGADVDLLLGYLVAATDWGHGYATELVGAAVTWAQEQDAIRSVAAHVDPDNAASARVLEKHGFAAGRWPPTGDLLFTLPTG